MTEILKPPPPRSSPFTGDSGPDIFSRNWSGWFRNIFNALGGGVASSTVPLAKLTTGGTNGSLTITNGVITGVTLPT